MTRMPPKLPSPAAVIRPFWRAQPRTESSNFDSALFSFLPAETLVFGGEGAARHAEHLGGVRRDGVELLPARRPGRCR